MCKGITAATAASFASADSRLVLSPTTTTPRWCKAYFSRVKEGVQFGLFLDTLVLSIIRPFWKIESVMSQACWLSLLARRAAEKTPVCTASLAEWGTSAGLMMRDCDGHICWCEWGWGNTLPLRAALFLGASFASPKHFCVIHFNHFFCIVLTVLFGTYLSSKTTVHLKIHLRITWCVWFSVS